MASFIIQHPDRLFRGAGLVLRARYLRPIIDRVFSFAAAAEAHRTESSMQFGKMV